MLTAGLALGRKGLAFPLLLRSAFIIVPVSVGTADKVTTARPAGRLCFVFLKAVKLGGTHSGVAIYWLCAFGQVTHPFWASIPSAAERGQDGHPCHRVVVESR